MGRHPFDFIRLSDLVMRIDETNCATSVQSVATVSLNEMIIAVLLLDHKIQELQSLF